jgi:regulator of replication initiation timing
MTALFVALGIMVLALLALLLWFVPHLLQQQAARVASETSQLREMLLDVLNEQEAVALRQSQLGASLSNLQGRIEALAQAVSVARASDQIGDTNAQQLELRLSQMHAQIEEWLNTRQRDTQLRTMQDNEAWANLMSLLSAIQERVGALSRDRATALAAVQAGHLLDELEREMQHMRSISDDIAVLQQRLRHSLNEHEIAVPLRHARAPRPANSNLLS